MGLGGATKKLQKVADMGEELYGKMNELREQILEVRETVQDTNRRVNGLENRVEQQGAILEALAEKEGIEVDELLTEVAIKEAEPAITEAEGDADDTDPEDGGAIADAEPNAAADAGGRSAE